MLGGMKTLFPIPAGKTRPERGLYLALTVSREGGKITELIAGLALNGPLYLVAGSEWMPGYDLARRLRRSVIHVDTVLAQVQMVRAFTCYQLLDLLAAIRPTTAPVLVLDILHNFYTEDIPLKVRMRTLKKCGQHLQRLSLSLPVAVLVQQTDSEDFPHFYATLTQLADEVYEVQAERPAASQLRLF